MQRPKRRILFVLCLAALLPLIATRESHARWQWYDGRNNLSGTTIWQIAEDPAGRVWLIDRGNNLKRNQFDDWPQAQSVGLLEELTLADGYDLYPVQTLSSGRDSSLWFGEVLYDPSASTCLAARIPGTRDGVSHLSQSMPGIPLAIAAVAADTAFVSTTEGFFRVDGARNNPNLFPPPFSPAPPGNWVNPMILDRSGDLWVGASERRLCGVATICRGAWLGVARLQGGQWRLYTTADGLAPEPVVGLLQGADGSIWAIHVGNHVSRFDGATWTFAEVPFKGPSSATTAWAADPRDGIWLGSVGALTHLAANGRRTFGAEEQVPPIRITALCVDHCGQAWVGFADGRVGRFSDEQRGDPRGPSGVRRLFEDRAGTVWTSSDLDSLRSFDGLSWMARGNGLPGGIGAVFETRSGVLWAATSDGVRRYEGDSWASCCADSSSPRGPVQEMVEAPNGTLWFEGDAGVWSYDNTSWSHYRRGVDFDTTAAGTNPNFARRPRSQWRPGYFSEHRILADSAGRVWVIAGSGCSMLEKGRWRDFRVADQLGYGATLYVVESPGGDVWVAHDQYGGLSRYRNGTWTPYPGESLGHIGFAFQLVFDRNGDLWALVDDLDYSGLMLARFRSEHWDLWRKDVLPDLEFACFLGLTPARDVRIANWSRSITKFEGETWSFHYTIWDGIRFRTGSSPGDPEPGTVLWNQRNGRLWLADGADRLRTFDPDMTPPQTVLLSAPLALTAERKPVVTAVGTRVEQIGLEYAFVLDGVLESGWSSNPTWQLPTLEDGAHLVQARARDPLGNVDPIPAQVPFTVDATAPVVSLLAPAFDAVVRGVVAIRGTILEEHRARTTLKLRAVSADSVAWDTLAAVSNASDTLHVIDTALYPDGTYQLALDVEDALGLRTSALTRFRIDNVAPEAARISPVDIERDSEGEVYSDDLRARAYFPPGSFAARTQVRLDGLRADSVAAGSSARFTALRGYRLDWDTGTLAPQKVGILDLSTEGLTAPGAWVVQRRNEDETSERLGGSLEGTRISVPLTGDGTFFVGWEDSLPAVGSSPFTLALSPRVFDLRAGGGAGGQLAIAFGLAQQASVTLSVYNRAGRRLRVLADHETMPQGAHVVRWDGRDHEGRLASDGLYMISAEFGGSRQVLPFAVVR